ncbi:MAG: hypothetical protein EBQ66_02255 [Flavobacteriia bacterium]|nr:hypothetical protein [Flavobacteriia bacterium]
MMIKKEFAMKHYDELSSLEESIHKVEDFKNIFKLVIAGLESDVELKVIKSVLYSLEQTIVDASDSLNESLNTVWNAVRDEDNNTFVTAGFQQSFMKPQDPIPALNTTNFSALTTADLHGHDSFLAGSTTSYAYDPLAINKMADEWRTMDQS